MVRLDEGGGGPTLDPKAKHYERELFNVFAVETGSISMTQIDWQDAKKELEDLAKDVRAVRGELNAPANGGAGWTGPAAVAALSTLQKLSDTLDSHAGEVGDVDRSLGQVYQGVVDAKASWYSDVSSVSTSVDPADHMRLPAPYAPTAANVSQYSVPDASGAAAAEDALWEKRNTAAQKILEQLATDTQTAKATMPIDVKDDTEAPYSNQGPATTDRTSGSATQSGVSGSPTGGTSNPVVHVNTGGQVGNLPDDTGLIPIGPDQNPPPIIVTEDPGLTPGTYDPISSDGEVTGTTGYPTATGPGGTPGSSLTGGNGGGSGGGAGVSGGGVAAGGLGGAAGLAGILRARGGGGMFSSGGTPRGGASSARGGAAGSRGQAFRTGGTARGGAGMVPGGGGQARGGAASAGAGAAGRGSAVKGSTGSGKYGVPKVGNGTGGVPGGGQGAKAGGRGAAGKGTAATGNSTGRGRAGSARGGATGATGAAGRGGARKGDDKGQPEDVAKLTLEDEETWYDGTEESSPQVWE